ncbi:MAG: Amidase enhancer precursor [Firmicutes bacterium ADurb.Bin419]|nr:MAG: Amidase enhancer precursor [Firmicutes bacterium ADurb.Bin419]
MLSKFYRLETESGKEKNVRSIKTSLFKKIILIAFSIIISFLSSAIGWAYPGVPEQVRIGLFFNDNKTQQYTAVSSFTVDSENGLQIGSYSEKAFTVLAEEQANSAITVRKDAFYVKKGGTLTEYSPDTKAIPEGDKVGAYHANLGSYGSYDELAPKLKELRNSGIDAYPVFSDSWQIWCGFYPDKNSIHAAFDGVLEYSIISPSATRIVICSSEGQVKLVYDSVSTALRIYPCEGGSPSLFRVNGDSKKIYRGGLEVLRQTGSDMTVINVLPTEEYLYGVVPGEIEAGSHVEALKAQAVAARTYTMNNLSKYSHLNFNLCTTTYTQVYKGYSVENSRTNKAINDTKSEVVTYNGKPAAVFYFSSSGGKTEDVKNVWGSEGYPYLVSVDDPYESGKSWHYNWQVSYTAKKIGEIMTQRGFKLGSIQAVYITKRSEAGRAIEVVVKGSSDQRVYTNGNTRSFLSLDSQWYDITTDSDVTVLAQDGSSVSTQLNGKKVVTSSGVKTINTSSNVSIISSDNTRKTVPAVPTTYVFTGKGWGHGIGMSQEGAKGMANEGFTYKEILTHYFTGTKVE